MIKIENTITPSPEQWKTIIMGARNPMNSWEKSDSAYNVPVMNFPDIQDYIATVALGVNDYNLLTQLAGNGPVHAKYRRMITVYCDITAPLYWWKEFDTYKVGTVDNSCSTMHKIAEKEFTLEDFSYEHLGVPTFATNENGEDVPVVQNLWEESLKRTINDLNIARNFYISSDEPGLKKQYWWQMIQLLPSSYNQRRTVMLNYEVLANIYHYRKDHKLDEWRDFCQWITTLPYSEIITGSNQS